MSVDVAVHAHHGFEPFAMADPFPIYAELRREEPVMFDEWSWVFRFQRMPEGQVASESQVLGFRHLPPARGLAVQSISNTV